MLLAAGILLGIIGVNVTAGEKRIVRPITTTYSIADPEFPRSLSHLLAPSWTGRNRVTVLVNGVQIFPAMLAAIRGARQSVTLESYIYWSGRVGREFADALAERARHGVHVYVLLDWAGSTKMASADADE